MFDFGMWLCDMALVQTNHGLKILEYSALSDYEKAMLRSHRYGQFTMKRVPMFKRVFASTVSMVNLVSTRGKDFFDELEKVLRELRTVEKFELVVDPNRAGLKQGASDAFVLMFRPVHQDDPIRVIAREVGIEDALYALKPAKRFERTKKLMAGWVKFPIAPRFKVIPNRPNKSGVGYINPAYVTRLYLEHGVRLDWITKLSLSMKEELGTDGWDHAWDDADIVIQEDGNKLHLSLELLSSTAAYDPSLGSAARFSQLLSFKTKEGKLRIGKPVSYGMHAQATYNIRPRFGRGDLDEINSVLTGNVFVEGIKEKFFMYLSEATGKLELTDTGVMIYEQLRPITDPAVQYGIQDSVSRRIKTLSKIYSEFGAFAIARPLSELPKEARHLIAKHVVQGFSGGHFAIADSCIYNDAIYVEDAVWIAMGRDWDGDLVFMYELKRHLALGLAANLKTLRENYVVPAKVEEVDERDDIKTLVDIMRQSRLCGIMHNNAKQLIDLYRCAGASPSDVVVLDMKLMALVESYIAGFKYQVTLTEVPTVAELASKFGISHVMNHAEKMCFFRVGIATGPVTINKVTYPWLVALKMMADKANPKSRSWWERYCAQFKDLNVELSGKTECNMGM